jgi:hypothetical protein
LDVKENDPNEGEGDSEKDSDSKYGNEDRLDGTERANISSNGEKIDYSEPGKVDEQE